MMSLTTHVLCYAKSLQSCPTLCDPTDCSLPGSSVHGILQARIRQWVSVPSSGIFWTLGSKPCLLYCRRILTLWSTWESREDILGFHNCGGGWCWHLVCGGQAGELLSILGCMDSPPQQRSTQLAPHVGSAEQEPFPGRSEVNLSKHPVDVKLQGSLRSLPLWFSFSYTQLWSLSVCKQRCNSH